MSIPSRNFMPEFLNCSEKMSLKAQKNCSCGMCSRTNYVALDGCNVCVDFICVIKYQQFLCAACDLSKLKSLTGKQGKTAPCMWPATSQPLLLQKAHHQESRWTSYIRQVRFDCLFVSISLFVYPILVCHNKAWKRMRKSLNLDCLSFVSLYSELYLYITC